MNTLIRAYQPTDLNGVLTAWENATRIAHPFFSEEFIAAERQNIPELYLPNAETWVAEQNGQVVGFMALIGNELGAVFVEPELQGQGIGTSLVNKAHERHVELEVEVFALNSIGQQFYEKYGFLPLSESVHEPTGEKLLRLKSSSASTT